MSSRLKRLKRPKPKRNICIECQQGNHSGHGHQVCPRCGHRIEPGQPHFCVRIAP